MEFEHLGLNALTVGFVGTIVFTCLQCWAQVKQNRKIWLEKSGKSIPVVLFLLNTAGLFAGFLMGLSHQSFALIFQGILLGALMAITLIGLWKFKGYTWHEKVLGLLLIPVLILDAYLPHKDWFWFTLSIGQVIAFGLQPIEIIRQGDIGVVEIRVIITTYIANFFWLGYSFAVGNVALEIIGVAVAMILTVTIVIWYKYRKPKLIPC